MMLHPSEYEGMPTRVSQQGSKSRHQNNGGCLSFLHGMAKHASSTKLSQTLQTSHTTITWMPHRCGAFLQGAWFHYDWKPHRQLSQSTSIQWHELFVITAAALTWEAQWHHKRIRFYCYNEIILHAWEGKLFKEPRLMSLMCTLFLTAVQNSIIITLKRLPGKLMLLLMLCPPNLTQYTTHA